MGFVCILGAGYTWGKKLVHPSEDWDMEGGEDGERKMLQTIRCMLYTTRNIKNFSLPDLYLLFTGWRGLSVTSDGKLYIHSNVCLCIELLQNVTNN